jgi:hypothetical protein
MGALITTGALSGFRSDVAKTTLAAKFWHDLRFPEGAAASATSTETDS